MSLRVENAKRIDQISLQSQGNPGAIRVLAGLLQRGIKIFDAVSKNLGKGSEIWVKYKDECGEDLDRLIEVYM